jgi:hypothetical protein
MAAAPSDPAANSRKWIESLSQTTGVERKSGNSLNDRKQNRGNKTADAIRNERERYDHAEK